jgi:ornithine carbamoyltransferase
MIMKKKDFLSITDFSAIEIWNILTLAMKLKHVFKEKGATSDILKQKCLVMIFEKPSFRTRLSFEIGMTKLGGHAVYLGPSDIQMGARESVADIAKVASSMGDIIMARTYKHSIVEELARFSKVPVINGLSDLEHPCQALADFMTILELKGKMKELKIAFVGDGENNIVHSLCLGASLLGMSFVCASPKGYSMKRSVAAKAKELSAVSGARILEAESPQDVLIQADVVYTDTWISMGDEKDKRTRLKVFAPYQVTEAFMSLARKDAIFMHDLPAYRGKEVKAEVIDGKQSVVFQQAENRQWVQMALLQRFLLGSDVGDAEI